MNPLRSRYPAVLISLCVLIAGTAGCSKHREGGEKPAQSHRIRGLVMALEPSRNRIVIAHEDIPGHMKAMTMPIQVRDSSLLRGIEVGDSVQGVVTMGKVESWIDSLTVTSPASAVEPGH